MIPQGSFVARQIRKRFLQLEPWSIPKLYTRLFWWCHQTQRYLFIPNQNNLARFNAMIQSFGQIRFSTSPNSRIIVSKSDTNHLFIRKSNFGTLCIRLDFVQKSVRDLLTVWSLRLAAKTESLQTSTYGDLFDIGCLWHVVYISCRRETKWFSSKMVCKHLSSSSTRSSFGHQFSFNWCRW